MVRCYNSIRRGKRCILCSTSSDVTDTVNAQNARMGEIMKKRVLALMLAVSLALVGCSGKGNEKETTNGADGGSSAQIQDASMTVIHDAVKAAYGENYLPSMPYDDTSLQDVFGVDPEWCEEYIAEGPMISAHVDTFVGIKAKSEEDKNKVLGALEEYRNYLINDSFQYPANVMKVQASEVISFENYVFFLMLGTVPMEVEEQGEDAVLAEAEAQNQIAVEAIRGVLYTK